MSVFGSVEDGPFYRSIWYFRYFYPETWPRVSLNGNEPALTATVIGTKTRNVFERQRLFFPINKFSTHAETWKTTRTVHVSHTQKKKSLIEVHRGNLHITEIRQNNVCYKFRVEKGENWSLKVGSSEKRSHLSKKWLFKLKFVVN